MNLFQAIKNIFWPPVLNRATGVDVSYYQDNNYTPQQITWPTLAKKATFAFIRAGFGGSVDSDFAYNWHNSRQAGIPRGAYWYLTSAVPATKAAYLFVMEMGGDFGELPPVADYEWQLWSSNGTARLYLHDFLEEVYRLTGKRCIIYTSASRWFAWGSVDTYWKQYELWVAHYNVNTPTIPRPWTTWLFWQYGTPTIVPAEWGVESLEIDADLFNGTAAEFYQRFGLTTIPAPTPDPQPVPAQLPPVLTIQGIIPEPKEKITIRVNAELADGDNIPYVLTYTPSMPPPPPVAPPTTGIRPTGVLYRVTCRNWSKYNSALTIPPNGGPMTIAMTRPRANGKLVFGDNVTPLPKAWEPWIQAQNTPKAWGKIIAPDYGPTFGYNSNNLLKWLGLAWPGNETGPLCNLVSVIRIEQNAGDTWALVESLPPQNPPGTGYSRTGTPWLIHEVYGSVPDGKSVSVAPTPCYVPILGGYEYAPGKWGWWMPAALLIKA